jgi:hypothetical protein
MTIDERRMTIYCRPRKILGKQLFFLDIIRRSEAFSEHRFQVFRRRRTRFQAGSRFFITETSWETTHS